MALNFSQMLSEAKRKAQLSGRPITKQETAGIAEGYASSASERLARAKTVALQERSLTQQAGQFDESMEQRKYETAAQMDAAESAQSWNKFTDVAGLTSLGIYGLSKTAAGKAIGSTVAGWMGGGASVVPGAGAIPGLVSPITTAPIAPIATIAEAGAGAVSGAGAGAGTGAMSSGAATGVIGAAILAAPVLGPPITKGVARLMDSWGWSQKVAPTGSEYTQAYLGGMPAGTSLYGGHKVPDQSWWDSASNVAQMLSNWPSNSGTTVSPNSPLVGMVQRKEVRYDDIDGLVRRYGQHNDPTAH